MFHAAASLAMAMAAAAVPVPAAAAPLGRAPSYDPALADQFQSSQLEDTLPASPDARQALARAAAFDATLFGTVAVLEYRQIYRQALDRKGPGFTGFDVFAHDRTLAGPGYQPFKSPNADTLYSNAYLDLTHGPVLFEVPQTEGRYFTAAFLDIYGNSTNISTRTHGGGGGTFLIATTAWKGKVPEGATVFRVTTPLMWILLRVLVRSEDDLPAANAVQDRFRLTPLQPPVAMTDFPDGRDETAAGFMRALDFVLRTCGNPVREDALVQRFRAIGIGASRPIDEALADDAIRTGVEQGFAEAQAVIKASMAQNGQRVGTWSNPLDVGRYGFNYLYRSAVNTLGTGANVVDENHAFTTFLDAAGEPLDGSKAEYRLKLSPPPPARYFWSVTVYDAATRELHPNPLGRYLVSDRSPALHREADGAVIIRFGRNGSATDANFLPIPAGRFYLAIRAQGPEEAIRSGQWRPPAVEWLGTADDGSK